ncbi:putative RNA polymerase I transcription initiation factor TAF1B/Rrn7 [Medicago truncatula]|uniref:Putative RNA polymerase I transcription initiation factor TAF1B/Rrn7 n=1 Tax=Medicago truncatula TaxID=3880 RepID=A0A396HSJ8_MEDTR|nr:putative RNA polymerase I transcription initiation factor TAF1B/Rrn7 [Medicago truncatula]
MSHQFKCYVQAPASYTGTKARIICCINCSLHRLGVTSCELSCNAIAYRYLKKLSLPVEKILPYACRIYEWLMPPDLWLSFTKDYFRLPTHVCAVSILVIAIRILYNINGYGEWEKSLSCNVGDKDNGEMDTTFASHDEHFLVKVLLKIQ